eukprot:TRINITY_DN59810_c0_g1_i1.p1 TRINITY_DN59810_c0_g1~~TRINITY_DN59810_c0_g1_i1.p1  ORF type:complete len:518 (-),score=81.48 TRINITY_DN59810_c0_g1_i1:199-1752(-)
MQDAMTAFGLTSSPLPKPGSDWHMTERYHYKKLLGTGSYGAVCQALDVQDDGNPVAVKRVSDIFFDLRDGKRILREIAIMRRLAGRSPYLVSLLDIISPRDPERFHDLYLVMEYFGQDLRAMSLRQRFFFTVPDVQGLMSDLLSGLSDLHAAGVFHRDLKPANVLVRERAGVDVRDDHQTGWELKLCDFGHARVVGEKGRFVKAPTEPKQVQYHHSQQPPREQTLQRHLTCHVATRWYRAPELILLQHDYTCAVDVWSAGCIAAELFRMLHGNAADSAKRGALFQGRGCFPLSPQSGDVSSLTEAEDQLALILNLLGSPCDEEIDEIARDCSSAVVKAARRYIRSFPSCQATDLQQLFPASSQIALDFLSGLLRFSPKRRLSVPEALEHPFMNALPSCCVQAKTFTSLPPLKPLYFEDEDLDEDQLRKLLLQEISSTSQELCASPEYAACTETRNAEHYMPVLPGSGLKGDTESVCALSDRPILATSLVFSRVPENATRTAASAARSLLHGALCTDG